MSDVAAAQLVRRRKAMGMTRDQLAERCRRAGLGSMTAAALANIETGRRDGAGRRRREVTVDELLAFGRALDVPPMALLVPLDDANIHELEPLAGWPLEPFRAHQWVTGEMTVRGGLPGDDDPREWWGYRSDALDAYARHEALVTTLVMNDLEAGDPTRRAEALKALTEVRDQLRRFRWRTPPVPDELRDVLDEREAWLRHVRGGRAEKEQP